jgi:hypothetical protein
MGHVLVCGGKRGGERLIIALGQLQEESPQRGRAPPAFFLYLRISFVGTGRTPLITLSQAFPRTLKCYIRALCARVFDACVR